MLDAHEIDWIYGLMELGRRPILVSGSQEALFLARNLVAKCVKERGLEVTWMADCIVLQEDWTEWDPDPWIRLASVKHKVIPTEQVLDRLRGRRIATHFEFGATIDFVFVKGTDVSMSSDLLRQDSLAGVKVHAPRDVSRWE